jgi:hypothetical protein
MNEIEIKVILNKTEILYIEVLRRFLIENNLAEDFFIGLG